MNPNKFYILGEEADDVAPFNEFSDKTVPTYWSNKLGRYTIFKYLATVYGDEILLLPCPEGSTAIIEETLEGNPCNIYLPSPVGDGFYNGV